MIEALVFKNLNDQEKSVANRTLRLATVTLVVGPNGSGKSTLLKEVEAFARSAGQAKILEDVRCATMTDEAWKNIVDSLRLEPNLFPPPTPDSVVIGRYNATRGQSARVIGETQLAAISLSKFHDNKTKYEFLVHPFVSYFSGRTRFELTNDVEIRDLKAPPQNALVALLKDNELRDNWRGHLFRAFQEYPSLDTTSVPRVGIRFSKVPPHEDVERTIKQCAVDYHQKSIPIAETSDGVQAYTGLVTGIAAGGEKVCLIDEPEAFLHPTLRRQCASMLLSMLQKKGGQALVSTHSMEFVEGCLQGRESLAIARLTRSDKGVSFKQIDAQTVTDLFSDPALRASEAAKALFYSNAVIVEGFTDKVVYGDINQRLLNIDHRLAIKDGVILYPGGKDQIYILLRSLRLFGIPAAAIYDIDILTPGSNKFGKVLSAANIPDWLRTSLKSQRDSLWRALESTRPAGESVHTVNNLCDEGKRLANTLLQSLGSYGIFIVPCGNLERWLEGLGVHSKDKNAKTWLPEFVAVSRSKTFAERVIDFPVSNFWRNVAAWVENERRLGMLE